MPLKKKKDKVELPILEIKNKAENIDCFNCGRSMPIDDTCICEEEDLVKTQKEEEFKNRMNRISQLSGKEKKAEYTKSEGGVTRQLRIPKSGEMIDKSSRTDLRIDAFDIQSGINAYLKPDKFSDEERFLDNYKPKPKGGFD